MAGGTDRIETLALKGNLREAIKAAKDAIDPLSRWWLSYLHNATGDFDEAIEVSMTLAQSSDDPEIASRSLITAASAMRQTRRHLPAYPLDESALRLAPSELTKAHALIGLAADCVGLGRESEAGSHIDAAAACELGTDWRVRVRLAWVRCEHALLARRARKAVTHARDALERSRAAGAQRHEAKSLLFLGVALRDAGDASWQPNVRESLEIAGRIGAQPIAQAAAAILPDVKVSGTKPSER